MWAHVTTSNEIERAIAIQYSNHWVNSLPLSLRCKFLKYIKRKKAGAIIHCIQCYSHSHLLYGVVMWLYLNGRSCRSQNSILEAESETHSRWRQPTPVTQDIFTASNIKKELFLTNLFSRETLLLITVSLSCTEIQVFKDGLEKYSQLMKVNLAPEWVFFSPYLLKARCWYKSNSHEELCLRLKINGVFFLHLCKKSNCFSIKQN